MNDIEPFGRKALEMFPAYKAGFEGVSPSFSILADHLKCAQNAHGVNKIDFYETVNTKKRKLAQVLNAPGGHIDTEWQKGYELTTSECTAVVRSIGEVAEWLKAPLSKSGIL